MSERRPSGPVATAELEKELTRIAWRVERWIDPGPSAVVAGAASAAVAASLLMPWSDPFTGWQVLTGQAGLGPLPRLFALVTITGLVVSALALLTRFWPLAWAATTVSAAGTVTGLWAVWSRQTGTADADIGPGLVVAVIGFCVLLVTWVRILLTACPRDGAPPA
ncbi:hypothetical protein H7X46_08725 [Pseudonocardia sp. C8]|uniref:Rv2732c family membrane protein n=1 Tax=Pseudonocardia sp. C8 TaxID=2762759 RepID=UPI0016435B3B|nr:hypothetical protein [Pseudonocardia sp. C8]MBC3191142.1 hypothetical protein [Pseudonocardia sp. C8]